MSEHIQSTHTCFNVLAAIKELDGAGVTDIANHTDISKGSAHKHLRTLQSRGYVLREGDTYHLGLKFLNLGLHARDRVPYYEVSKQEIERLVKATGERAALLTEENGEAIYLHMRTGRENSNQNREGYIVPLHICPGGKAILANLPPSRRDEILDATNEGAEIKELRTELKKIRQRGIAIDRGDGIGVIRDHGTSTSAETVKDARGIGVPIFDNDGYPLAAIEVTGPTGRLSQQRLEGELIDMVTTAVNTVTRHLNGEAVREPKTDLPSG